MALVAFVEALCFKVAAELGLHLISSEILFDVIARGIAFGRGRGSSNGAALIFAIDARDAAAQNCELLLKFSHADFAFSLPRIAELDGSLFELLRDLLPLF